MSIGDESAFPTDRIMEFGLTKREYIAAMAMQGMQANPWVMQQVAGAIEANVNLPNIYELAVQAADILIRELNLPKTPNNGELKVTEEKK